MMLRCTFLVGVVLYLLLQASMTAGQAPSAGNSSLVPTSVITTSKYRVYFMVYTYTVYGFTWEPWMPRLYFDYRYSKGFPDECSTSISSPCNNTLVHEVGAALASYPSFTYDYSLNKLIWIDDNKALINSMHPDGSGLEAIASWPHLVGGLAYDSKRQIVYFFASPNKGSELHQLWSYSLKKLAPPVEVMPGQLFRSCRSIALNQADNVLYFYNLTSPGKSNQNNNITLLGWSIDGQGYVDVLKFGEFTSSSSTCSVELRYDNINDILFGTSSNRLYSVYSRQDSTRTTSLWKNTVYRSSPGDPFSLDEQASTMFYTSSYYGYAVKYARGFDGVTFFLKNETAMFYVDSTPYAIFVMPCVDCVWWTKDLSEVAVALLFCFAAVIGPAFVFLGRWSVGFRANN